MKKFYMKTNLLILLIALPLLPAASQAPETV